MTISNPVQYELARRRSVKLQLLLQNHCKVCNLKQYPCLTNSDKTLIQNELNETLVAMAAYTGQIVEPWFDPVDQSTCDNPPRRDHLIQWIVPPNEAAIEIGCYGI